MKKFLMIVGVIALLAWTLGGLGAWMLTKQGVQITVREGGANADGSAAIASLEDRLGTLERDLQSLAATLGQNFEILQDGIRRDGNARERNVQSRLAALDTALKSAVRTLQAQIAAANSARPPNPVAAAPDVPKPDVSTLEVPKPERPRAESGTGESPTTFAPRGRKSFLSFALPSTKVRFAKRQKWTVVPSLSRVGFDAKSTLHDFTGVTSKLSGFLELDLADPAEKPEAGILVDAKSLVTGIDERDENMWTNLGVENHPKLRFVLQRMEAPRVDRAKETVTAKAVGKMTIRGVTRSFAMPVTLHLDASRRLRIAGETDLDLTDFSVPVPNTLGVVKMDKDVRLWIRLRARVVPEAEK